MITEGLKKKLLTEAEVALKETNKDEWCPRAHTVGVVTTPRPKGKGQGTVTGAPRKLELRERLPERSQALLENLPQKK